MGNGRLDVDVALLTNADRTVRSVDVAVDRAVLALLDRQYGDGHWCFELEADCTIPSEYILMMHHMGEVDRELESKICVYLRRRQGPDGGWPLYFGGDSDLSCSVKTYYALKLAGDAPDETHMARAREWILSQGGAARSNVFTRITLAFFRQIPWRGVPFIPVEIVLLPKWFPFHLDKVSYWSRTVMVPLFVLTTLKPVAANPGAIDIRELFLVPADEDRDYFPVRSPLNWFFNLLDAVGRRLEPFIPAWVRRKALKKAENWILERLNGDGGLGAIFPAMVNAYEALTLLGYPPDAPARVQAKEAIDRLLVVGEEEAYCQPCVSPVWDTGLSILALQEADSPEVDDHVDRALQWLVEHQLVDVPGDWKRDRPALIGGGWPFQYRNDHYPDLDDTAIVAHALHAADPDRFRKSYLLAAEWIRGMQSKNGGFASFDVDNDKSYLNEIPFADHGALLDPPTSDVSARCAMFLGPLTQAEDGFKQALERTVEFLLTEQEEWGSWYGRWGTNHIYGTWSVLVGLEAAGFDMTTDPVRRATTWLKSRQCEDGGWGESNDSYMDGVEPGVGGSTSFQTAWALLALMAAKETDSSEVRRGVDYLLRRQEAGGLWHDDAFTCPGFPRVFYLKYHGYEKYFPLWALARYRRLTDPDR